MAAYEAAILKMATPTQRSSTMGGRREFAKARDSAIEKTPAERRKSHVGVDAREDKNPKMTGAMRAQSLDFVGGT